MKTPGQVRVWAVRLALLFGLGWFAAHLASYRSTNAAVLGRYSGSYFAFVALGAAASIAGAALTFRPWLARLVLTGRLRPKAILLGAWLPGALLLYAPGYALAPDKPLWNAAFGGLFWAGTAAVVVAVLDAVPAMVSKPELWMVVVSLLVALGLAEGAMRYWVRHLTQEEWQRQLYDPAALDTSALPRYQPHHYEGYIPRPGWVGEGGTDRINALGFRGEEIAVPKPDGVYRIVAVGGSTTYGARVPTWQGAYPAQLENILRRQYGYTNVEVINGGAPGYNSWETLVNLEFRVLDLEPDLVIVYQNTNDVHARIVPPDAYKGDNSGRRKVWDAEAVERATSWRTRIPSVLWRFVAVNFGWLGEEGGISLDAVVSNPCSGTHADEDCLGMTPQEALEANPPVYYERNIRNMVAIAQANGVEVLLLTWAHNPAFGDYASRPDYQMAFEEHNAIVKRLSEEMGTYFYDFAADMPLDEAYWVEGRHMTVEGNRVRAELIAAHLDENNVIPRP
jgi:hypothetical protein